MYIPFTTVKFEVPQFIDIEDKVFGPLTFKQFIYLAGAAGLSVVIWFFIPKILAVLLIAGVAGLGFALAFYKVNDRPFVGFLETALKFFLSKKLYIWKKEPRKATSSAQETTGAATAVTVPRLSDSKLRDLAWSLDVHDSLYSEQQQ